jgi:asparagine synthase (glutamine-hydrolysing)
MSGFVGYWGCGAYKELELLLTRCLETIPGTSQRISLTEPPANGPDLIVAGIACWGTNAQIERETKDVTTSLAGSLSASGISATQDVWVKAERHCLRLGREPFGRATLYWTHVKDVIWFASRLQSLLPILKSRDVAIAGLYGYTCFSFVPAPLTPLENVFAIAAGSESVWRVDSASQTGSKLSTESVRLNEWRESERQICSEEQATLQLRGNLEKAIGKQVDDLTSSPVAVFLSGGLDSSVTAALLSRAGVKVRAYTLDFGEYGLSEVQFAERVAEALSIPLVKVQATPRRIRDAVAATAEALDVPFGDGVTVPLFLLGEAASRDATVVFNGEGGDQLFGGWTNKPLIAAGVYQNHHPDGGVFKREYLRTFHRLHGYEPSVYTEATRSEIAKLDPLDWLAPALDETFTHSLLQRLRRANLMLKGAQNIQPRATALAFAHGLSVRTPFCDSAVAEWTFRLAGDLCLRGPCEKYLLKRAVEDWLPPEIVWREKRGMGVPLTAWCLGPLRRAVGERLKPKALEDEGRFQPDLASRVALGELSGHVQGRRIGEILWLLLMWQEWRRTVLKEEFKLSFHNPFWLPPQWWQWRFRDRQVSPR